MRMKKNVYVIKEGKSKVLNKWSKADGFCKKKRWGRKKYEKQNKCITMLRKNKKDDEKYRRWANTEQF